MIEEKEFLNCIFKNAEMGVIGIKYIIEKVDNKDILLLLSKQYKQYQNICEETQKIIKKCNYKVMPINNYVKLMSKIMSELKTLKNNSNTVIIKMMIEGTNKGIIEIKEKLNKKLLSNTNIISLGEKLLLIEEKNIEELKKYL